MAICLVLHPILLEVGESLSRGSKADTIALALRMKQINTYEEAVERIVEKSLNDSGFKLLMAFFRRFMLLNMGSAQATMFAVVAASIEEARAN